MYKNLTKWLGVSDNTEKEVFINDNKAEERVVKQEANASIELVNPATFGVSEKQESPDQEKNDDLISPQTKQTLEEVSAKAINAAKEWGNILFNFGKHATEVVSEKAKVITKTVEEKTFLGDFSKEQHKFVTEQKERDKKSEAAVPPWVGYNEEVAMKSQILALSQDKRNFVRNPPAGIQFQFDFGTVFPVAMATLHEDLNLQKMRFELVPKQFSALWQVQTFDDATPHGVGFLLHITVILLLLSNAVTLSRVSEEVFWRNYFYRVSLIKQSAQLTSIAQQAAGNADTKIDSSQESSSSSDTKEKCRDKLMEEGQVDEELEVGSQQHDNEFVSDTFPDDDHISNEEFKKEMRMLGMEDDVQPDGVDISEPREQLPEWEQELQRELQDYEMGNNDTDDIDNTDIEREILKQIEESTDS